MKKNKVLVFGASGLVGKSVVNVLSNSKKKLKKLLPQQEKMLI